MKVLNYGSLNIDKVYDVDHFVHSEETILANGYAEFLGGKGLNQSVALARAGAEVYHLGAVGKDGDRFCPCLREAGVNTEYIYSLPSVSGHAIIQSVKGQNCIIVCSGANGEVSEEKIRMAVSHFDAGDIFLVQNEVAHVAAAIRCAKSRGMKVAFNASPITPQLFDYPLELVDYFLINEVEARILGETMVDDYEEVMSKVHRKFPHAAIVMTVGADGVLYEDRQIKTSHAAYKVPIVDTTAAGDTFCGYFIGSLTRGFSIEESLEWASKAGALSIGIKGASNSIPLWRDVENKDNWQVL